MKEIKTILEAYSQVDFTQHQVALATVVRVVGSSYRRTGARMLVSDSGQWVGGISGGCLEGDALKKARLAMAQGKAALVTYDTTDDDPYQIGVGLGCNGIIDVLLTPINPQDAQNPVLLLQDCPARREPALLVTVLGVGGEVEIPLGKAYRFDDRVAFGEYFPLTSILAQVSQDAQAALGTGKSVSHTYTLPHGDVSLLHEVLPPAIHLVLYGGSYDVYPLVRLAKEVGWKITVVCNPAKVHASLFETADAVVSKDTPVAIDAYTAAVLMAHDYETDYQNLRKLLHTPIKYIGMLGPRKRTTKMIDRAIEEQNPIENTDLERIFSPVGLDTGATTPEEIAVSILAEIRAHWSDRDGKRLKTRDKPIYE